MKRPAAVLTLSVLAAAVPPRGEAQEGQPAPAPRARGELLRFAELLDLAAGQVSRPSPFQLMGGSTAASGYLLPGIGALFVLPARALPAEDGVIVLREGAPPILLRRGSRPAKPQPPAEAEFPVVPELRGYRDMQQMETVVESLAREAEQTRREAEATLDRMLQELRERYPQADVPPPPSPASAPVASPPPAAAITAPPPAPPAPVAPPWRSWFPADPGGDSRSPEQIVSDVKQALIRALELRGATLTSVRGDDALIVAVDFTARGFLHPERRAERTLVVKARKRDLDERRANRLSAEELRKRIEALEY